jgi:hypothetical protein
VRYLDLQNATFLFQVIKPHLQKVCQWIRNSHSTSRSQFMIEYSQTHFEIVERYQTGKEILQSTLSYLHVSSFLYRFQQERT